MNNVLSNRKLFQLFFYSHTGALGR